MLYTFWQLKSHGKLFMKGTFFISCEVAETRWHSCISQRSPPQNLSFLFWVSVLWSSSTGCHSYGCHIHRRHTWGHMKRYVFEIQLTKTQRAFVKIMDRKAIATTIVAVETSKRIKVNSIRSPEAFISYKEDQQMNLFTHPNTTVTPLLITLN